MAGLGRRTFTAGEILTASNVMGYLQDQAVQVYAGTAARGSAIGTAVSEGMITYQKDNDRLDIYDGSEWASNNSLVYMKPSSAAVGSGSCVNNNRSVSFTGATNISLQNIFSSEFRNYKIIVDGTKATTSDADWAFIRLLDSSSSESSANYAGGFNGIEAGYTATTNLQRTDMAAITYINNIGYSTVNDITISRPYLSEYTYIMADSLGFAPGNTTYRSQAGIIHTLSNSYTGIKFGVTGGGTLSGQIQVFGYND